MKYICPRGIHGAVDPSPPGVYPKCSKCRKERDAGRLTGRRWMELRKKVLGIYRYQCAAIKDGQRCDVVLGLQVHHTNGLDDNSIQSLVPACPECHRELEHAPRAAFVYPPVPLIG